MPCAFLGGSGVLATLAVGMYIGEQRPALVPFGIRLHLTSVWKVLVYVLNGVLFLLTGLQARFIWAETEHPYGPIIRSAACIAITVISLRMVWAFAAEWLGRRLLRSRPMPLRQSTYIGWSGLRGAISLAAALSIPVSVPSRGLIVYVTAGVIAATLLVQGTPIFWLVRLLRLDRDAAGEKSEERRSESKARIELAQAAADAIQNETADAAVRLRREYQLAKTDEELDTEKELDLEARLRQKTIKAQRERILEMYREGEVSGEVLNRIERSLDLQEAATEYRVSSTE